MFMITGKKLIIIIHNGGFLKIIVFGSGVIYRRYAAVLKSHCEIIAIIDNNDHINYGGVYIDGYPVYKPEKINDFEYDKVVIASTFIYDMRQQLLSLGVPEEKIISCDRFASILNRGQIIEISSNPINDVHKKKVIVLAYTMNLNGGSMAAVYAAYTLNSLGFDVTVGAAEIDTKIQNDLNAKGISVAIIKGIFCPGESEKEYLKKYDLAIVNVYQNLPILACISSEIKCIWWIHESISTIKQYYSEYRYISTGFLKHINIYAVSSVAKVNMLKYYPGINIKILTCGIPDEFLKTNNIPKVSSDIVFGVIGGLSRIKGQDIMIDAIKIFNSISNVKAQFLFIGDVLNTSFSREVQSKAKGINNIKFVGLLDRNQMKAEYDNIDVVVSSSREETLSLVIVEGMMLKKVCIAPDKAGVSDYMINGFDGFVYKTGDAEDLARSMIYVTENYQNLKSVRENARKTYLRNFSINMFEKNLKEIVNDTINDIH